MSPDPYVDFLCTDEYVLTFTHPVFTHPEGPVAGIVGMDATVQRLERGNGGPGSGAARADSEQRPPG
jgi:hypothetical protein